MLVLALDTCFKIFYIKFKYFLFKKIYLTLLKLKKNIISNCFIKFGLRVVLFLF